MKNALITGAAKRIGRTLALELAKDGWSIAIHHNNSEPEAESLKAEIEAMGGRATTLQADLRNAAAPAEMMAEASRTLGAITLLINNASLFESDEAETMSVESWDDHAQANLRAPAFLAQAFAAQLPAESKGNIINIIDQRVWRPTPRFLSYTISKMGLWDLTQVLAMSLAPDIRVNGIGPGPTLANARQSQEDFERQTRATILGHGTSPDEIATAVRFILAAPAMTGQMIALDGGQHLAWETPDILGIPE
ncbi:MAG: SDR family oxidoreductase [Rhizobiales bacterium]|nr:SDR family oxidoreductase [Hyphomicrobiales bacterium]